LRREMRCMVVRTYLFIPCITPSEQDYSYWLAYVAFRLLKLEIEINLNSSSIP